MVRRVVPYRREIKRGTKGKDVVALKRALSRSGLLAWKGAAFTPLMGPFAVKALQKFQRRVKLPGDGVYGPRTHAALVRQRYHGVQAFDRYSAFLMASASILTPSQQAAAAELRRELDVRRKIVALCWLSYGERDRMHYTQGPLRWYGLDRGIYPPNVPSYGDCSAWLTWVLKRAGVRNDPNGYGWRAGFTCTLLQHGRRVVGQPMPGDASFYGGGTGKHVAIYVGKGLEIGFGSERGPSLTSTRYRRDHRCYIDYVGGNA